MIDTKSGIMKNVYILNQNFKFLDWPLIIGSNLLLDQLMLAIQPVHLRHEDSF